VGRWAAEVGGRRTCRSSGDARRVLKRHLAEFPAENEELIFRGPLGAPLRRSNFHRSVRWSQSVVEAGLPAGFHFHDLRHPGNNLAAASGASPPRADAPMGHGNMRAALIYQHATDERDREIADASQFRAWRRRKGEMTRDFAVERVTRIELA
jgi:integrase